MAAQSSSISAFDVPDETVTPTATLTGTVTLTPTLTMTLTPTQVPVGTPLGSVTPDRVTICHHTGSQSNPYVMITVDRNALPAHAAHGDIIPAPPEGCPAVLTPTNTGTATPMTTASVTGTPSVTSTPAT